MTQDVLVIMAALVQAHVGFLTHVVAHTVCGHEETSLFLSQRTLIVDSRLRVVLTVLQGLNIFAGEFV